MQYVVYQAAISRKFHRLSRKTFNSHKSEKENNFLVSLCTKLGTKTPQQWRAAHGGAHHCAPGSVFSLLAGYLHVHTLKGQPLYVYVLRPKISEQSREETVTTAYILVLFYTQQYFVLFELIEKIITRFIKILQTTNNPIKYFLMP